MAAATIAAAIVAGGIASCDRVLGLDGYDEAPLRLCELLDRCYGRDALRDCLGHVRGGIEVGSDEQRNAWLTSFSDKNCLKDCESAWLCLDVRPVCKPGGAQCADVEQCCGFTKGRADCADDRCCAPAGVKCDSNGDCCEGVCDPDLRTCGGVVCAESGASCTNDFECCTQVCDPTSGKCSETVCASDGFPCQQDFDCCSKHCDEQKMCAPAPCGQQGATCGGDGECCSGFCYEEYGVCSTGECVPDFLFCQTDDECCSKHCDPEFHKCGQVVQCEAIGRPCAEPSDCCSATCDLEMCTCAPDGSECIDVEQCCNNVCTAGRCGGECLPTEETCSTSEECCSGRCDGGFGCCAPPGCAHDQCSPGGPLSASSCADCADCDKACIQDICNADPYCCCIQWDDSCIAEVQAICDSKCAR